MTLIDTYGPTMGYPNNSVGRGDKIRQLVEAQVSALDALGKSLDRFDKVVLAHAAVDVLWPTAPVDMPSWSPVAQPAREAR